MSLSAAFISTFILPTFMMGTFTAASAPTAFISAKSGFVYPASQWNRPAEPMSMSLDNHVRLRRRSLLHVNDVKEISGVGDEMTDNISKVSTDEESLESVVHRTYEAKPIKSDGPIVWGVPLQSIILLNIAAVIWGTQHAVIKSVVDDISIGPDATIKEWVHGLLGYHESAAGDVAINDGDAAAYFTLARFGLAALLASPYTPGLSSVLHKMKSRFGLHAHEVVTEEHTGFSIEEQYLVSPNRENTAITKESNLSWRYGIELGIYMFLGYAFQAIGLETTTASRSGFLLYLNVKLVPFFSFLIFGKQIRASTWVSALVAFCGTALLTLDDSGDASNGLSFGLNTGDLWSIAAAAASAMFILRTEAASKAVSKSSELNAASLWVVSLLSFVWTLCITSKNLSADVNIATNAQMITTTIRDTVDATLSTFIDHPLQMFYLSAVTTTLANYIQSKGQKDISAERASIIYAMDPVYGALVANFLLGEQLGTIGWVGSGLIFAAAATNAIFDFGPADEEDKS